ncbi:MAG TPA: hypothetical protein VL371_15800, partial [Gemmataceae bacterium]|nr:hypothetical protein [Gemmataceae bacterium]
FEYAVCPGANTRSWTLAEHTWAFDRLKELKDARPGGKPFGVRVEGFANNAGVNRDVEAARSRSLTPHLCWDGSAGVHTLDTAGLTAFAKKYPGCVYSGPNEPDLDRGTKKAWPAAQYVAFCKQLYDTVKAADPTAVVLYGELWKGQLPAGVTTWDQKDPAKYLRPFITEFIAAGMPADAICHHSYDDPADIKLWWNMWGWWYEGGIYGTGTGKTFSEMLKAAGWTKPIMDTESGSQVNSGQAGKITRLLDFTKTGPSDATTIYSFYNNGDGYPIADKATLTVNAGYTAFKTFMASA